MYIYIYIYSPECQGVPFSPISQNHYLFSSPISVDPICPQPKVYFAKLAEQAERYDEMA